MFPWPARGLHAVGPLTIHCRDLAGRVGSLKAGRVAVLHCCHTHVVQLPTPAYNRSFRNFFPPYEPTTDLLFSDSSGTITFDEFKNVFAATLGADALPFNFDWYALLASTE